MTVAVSYKDCPNLYGNNSFEPKISQQKFSFNIYTSFKKKPFSILLLEKESSFSKPSNASYMVKTKIVHYPFTEFPFIGVEI